MGAGMTDDRGALLALVQQWKTAFDEWRVQETSSTDYLIGLCVSFSVELERLLSRRAEPAPYVPDLRPALWELLQQFNRAGLSSESFGSAGIRRILGSWHPTEEAEGSAPIQP
jgi:hypothetical protein